MQRGYLLFSVFIGCFIFSVQLLAQKNQQSIDTRVDNMGYWKLKAEQGLVPVAPVIPFKQAEYKSSKIDAVSVITENSPDVPVTAVTSVTESENSVFVDPNDADYLLNSNNSTSWSGGTVGSLYGANYFHSADGGSVWGGSYTGAGGSNSGDPATAISQSGRQYVGYITSSSGQGVSYSDNGDNWTAVTVAPNPGDLADKNHMWIDNSLSSAYEGNLYDAWTSFGGTDDAEIVISRSTNNGQSWSSAINISSAVSAGSHNQGVNLKTGPNGEVYAVWAIYDSWPSDESALGFAKSINGGATFAASSRIISNIRGIRTTETSKNHRVNSFPSMAVDISSGPNSGNIYIVWSNVGVPGTNSGTNISVYMIRSTDNGSSWSTPIRVNQNTYVEGKEAYFPWITCDPETGTISVIFYDDRNTTSASCEVFVANSFDGGDTWEDFVVSDVAFTPAPIPGLADGYMGDYLGITAQGGTVYPCWTDNRGGLYMTYVSPFITNNLERPTDLAATLNETTGQVDLTWNFNSVSGFLYFNIYRDGAVIGTSTTTSFTDYLPDYGLYNYQVTAVHSDGESVGDATDIQWGNAGISATPVSFNVTLPPDASTTEMLTITNTGELDLDYTVSTVINTKAPATYCTASGGCDEYISRVVFNTIDNVTGCSGYGDYTAISTTVNAGDTYNLTIENGNTYASDDLGVWIDWNQDEDFDDAGENVVCDIDNNGYGTFAITIPSDATAGATIMRIRMKWSGSDCGSSCGTTTYGEVEDYTINVMGWLQVNPLSGTVASGMSDQLDVIFDATDLAEGVYNADVIVNSNDPTQPQIIIPATLNISLGNPQINVSTTSLAFGDVQVGNTSTLQFTIENTGTGTLAGTITTPAGFTVAAAKGNGDNVLSFAVNEGITETYDLIFEPTIAQPYSGNVVISHNAPGNQDLIAVSGTGLPGPEPSIAISPDNLYVTLQVDEMADQFLTLSNTGDAILSYSTAVNYNSKSAWYNAKFTTGYTQKNFKSSKATEMAPFKQAGYSYPDATGDILLEFNAETPSGDNQLLGSEFDGTNLWFSGGGASGTNMFYKFDVSGSILASYSQGTSSDWGVRDMAFDGTYIYGGDENGFYRLDPVTGSVTTMFTGNLGLTCIRALAYEPVSGHFLASNWDTQIIEFDASGTTYGTYTASGLSTIYGMAYDEHTGNLWLFDRTGSPATSLYEYSLSTLSLTGVSIQVPLLTGLTDQMNGGIFFSYDLIADKGVIGGMVQGTDYDTFFAMELYDTPALSWLTVTANGSGNVAGGGSTDVTVHFDATGLSYGIYTGNIEITSNDPYNPSILVPCTLEVADVPAITLDIKAMLEGPYFNGNMVSWINLFGLLPLSQPYNTAPWSYNGTESVAVIPSTNVVDWCLVELRETSGDASTATSDKMVAQQAGFILTDGSIVNTTGSGPLSFSLDVTQNLYAVIWHRNHLGIMSSQALVESGGSYTYDFTTDATKVYGGALGTKEIAPGLWAMISGDGNADGKVENRDKNDVWIPERGSTGYFSGDFNMNTNVLVEDKDLYWAPNAGKGTKVAEGMPDNGFSSQVPE